MRLRRALRPLPLAPIVATLIAGCGGGDDGGAEAPQSTLVLASDLASVAIGYPSFALEVRDANGQPVLSPYADSAVCAGVCATIDEPYHPAQTLPGWDGYVANEQPWRRASHVTILAHDDSSAKLALSGPNVVATLDVSVVGSRVKLHLETRESEDSAAPNALNEASLSFATPADEHFFGMGERFATVDHRGFSLYSWAEEGALGKGENVPPGPQNPYPNGPSMTYFPVPFFLSSKGYAMHLATTFRTVVHFADEAPDALRVAVGATKLDAVVYVRKDPMAALSDFTEDTGRPMMPAPWAFGPRRRVSSDYVVNGVPEYLAMRQAKVPCTAVDDSVHFLPASSQTGREAELSQWTTDLHAMGYKATAYNNPYVAKDDANAAADYAYGEQNGLFLKGPDEKPVLTQFISGKMLTLATIDLTNPAAVTWFQSLLQRTLDLGYDGWMHDFGEYVPRNAIAFDGRGGEELHNAFPLLSQKAAHDLMEAQKPGDYTFYVRSGGAGTQALAPQVWGGDAEATFDETQGLPSAVRGGVNLGMTGVPFWSSDVTGFKCIIDAPHDKDVFLRWVEMGSVQPMMQEENACSNPLGGKQKWTLWSDADTTATYAKYSGLHTRLQPYLLALAKEAVATGHPLTRHPFLVHPEAPEAAAIDDAFYLGPSLYASPIVRRAATEKSTWLPPGRFVDWEDFTVYEGGKQVTIPAPLEKLPLFFVENGIVPMLDPSIQTLAPATDPSVVTPATVADRLDVVVALGPSGSATLELLDGTVLEATRAASDAGNPDGLAEQTDGAAMADCASCFFAETKGDVDRLRANSALAAGSELTLNDVHLVATGGPSRRIRWDVLRLR